MNGADQLLSIIRSNVDSQSFREVNWTGSFRDYLNRVYENPRIIRNAFQRIYDMVISHGFDEYLEHKERRIRYRFFADSYGTGEDAIFGLDRSVMRLVDVLKAGAHGY